MTDKLPDADNKTRSAKPPSIKRTAPPPVPPVSLKTDQAESVAPIPPKGNPLRALAMIVFVGIVLIIASYYVVVWSAKGIAKQIPYETETALLGGIAEAVVGDAKPNAQLQVLADKLARAMDMDDGQPLKVYIADEPTINAHATFGGHVVFYQGLLDRLNSEQAVAMVLAHELAHVKHRDPLVETAGSFGVQFAADYWFGTGLLSGQVANLTQLSHSREAETRADMTGFQALAKVYGSGYGMNNVYDVLGDAGGETLAWLSSHPDTDNRKASLRAYADDNTISLLGEKKPNIWRSTPTEVEK